MNLASLNAEDKTTVQKCIRLISEGESVPSSIAKKLQKGSLGLIRAARKHLLARGTKKEYLEPEIIHFLKMETPRAERKVDCVKFLIRSREPRVSVRSLKCDECGNTKSKLYRYYSDKGPVNVCHECHDEVFERSFPHDISIKALSGGGVSTGKVKYKHR